MIGGWRFYPTSDHPRAGVLVSPEGKPNAALFLTPADARIRRERETAAKS